MLFNFEPVFTDTLYLGYTDPLHLFLFLPAAMIVSFLLLFAVVSVLFTNVAEGCGTSTHINIAHEASTFYKSPLDAKVDYASIIRKHSDAFVAGNPYPDAMYPSICFGGKYHSVAEDTHWAPFLNATVYYIRQNYPQPWDEDTEKLVAFLFGFISHQVADITWHSLAGFEQGFLRTMANVNFHGVFDQAHGDGDVGGDMLTQYDKADKIVGITKWYVPVDDLYEIYKEYYQGNQTVPEYVIEICSEFLFIEYIAETFAGAKIFKPFVKKSPFLLNQLDNYFLGGIHDMAAWTSQIWNETVHMLEHGTDECNMESSTVHVNCTGYLPPDRGKSEEHTRNPGRMYPLQTAGWDTSHVEKIRSNRGVYFVPGKEMKIAIAQEMERRQQKKEELETTEHSYAQIGRSMTEITIQKKKHMVISAPTYSEHGLASLGKVWIVPADKFHSHQASDDNEWLNNLDDMATTILKGSQRMSRFGWAVCGVAFNRSMLDDIEDLLVSAPITGSHELQYKGAVYVYSGSAEGLSSTPNITLTMEDDSQPAAHAHTNYGYSITKASPNWNRYLMVTTPFYDDQSGLSYSPETGEVAHQGGQNFSWFGYSRDAQHVHVPQTYFDVSLEVIGSPNYRICHLVNCTYHPLDKQAVGQLQYTVDGHVVTTWTGTQQFEELGYATSMNFITMIAISSPGKNVKTSILGIPVTLEQAGSVSVYQINNVLKGTYRHIADFVGDRSYGRFGEYVKLAEIDGKGGDELIVGAPRRTVDFTEEIYGGEEGAVFVYKIPEDRSHDDKPVTITTDHAWKSYIGDEPNARFGTSFHVLKTDESTRLIVGATSSSKYGFKTGRIYNFDVTP